MAPSNEAIWLEFWYTTSTTISNFLALYLLCHHEVALVNKTAYNFYDSCKIQGPRLHATLLGYCVFVCVKKVTEIRNEDNKN